MERTEPMGFQTGVGQRTALVTGSASDRGIGYATAQRYAQEGWAVALLDLDAAVVAEKAASIASQYGVPTVGIGCNVAEEDSVAAALATFQAAALPPLGAIANVAGVASPPDFLDLTLVEWNRVIGVNLTGSFLICRAFVPLLPRRPSPPQSQPPPCRSPRPRTSRSPAMWTHRRCATSTSAAARMGPAGSS